MPSATLTNIYDIGSAIVQNSEDAIANELTQLQNGTDLTVPQVMQLQMQLTDNSVKTTFAVSITKERGDTYKAAINKIG